MPIDLHATDGEGDVRRHGEAKEPGIGRGLRRDVREPASLSDRSLDPCGELPERELERRRDGPPVPRHELADEQVAPAVERGEEELRVTIPVVDGTGEGDEGSLERGRGAEREGQRGK